MKKKWLAIITIILMSFSFVSCDPASTYKKEITTIDSCLTLVDSLQVLYDGIEFDSLELMYNHVMNNEDAVKRLFTTDTVNQKVARQLNDAKSVRKAFKSVSADKIRIQTEFTTAKTQLESLKLDITNGVLTEDQIKQYLAEEKQAVTDLRLAFIGFYEMQKREKSRYYLVTPGIDVFVDELIANQKENVEG